MWRNIPLFPLGVMLAAAIPSWLATRATAADFAVSASPPRFELALKPGEVSRQVIDLENAQFSVAKYAVHSADWTLDANSGAQFDDALAPGSCRPWVAIERHDVEVPARGHYRYRFQVAPPASAPRGECRFAILIEGQPESVETKTGPSVPLSGRLGVIVYVNVGGAQPDLRLAGSVVGTVNGMPTPILRIQNTGDAHGRLSGYLSGVDAQGKKLAFTPSSLPILPGETRPIPLLVDQPDSGPRVVIHYPITIHGKLRWADRETAFSQAFAP